MVNMSQQQQKCHYRLLLLFLILQKIISCSSFVPVYKTIAKRPAQVRATTSDKITGNENTKSDESIFNLIKNSQVISPSSSKICNALEEILPSSNNKESAVLSVIQNVFGANRSSGNDFDYLLVIVMPQLGDFDSAEYAESLSAVQQDLIDNKIALRIIGLGDEASAKMFSNFSGLDINTIRVDPRGNIHDTLNLHRGPNWDVPSFIPDSILEWFADYCGAKETTNDDGSSSRDSKAITRSWLNYMAMCAGISAPDTLPEILRGYLGDKEAPERLQADDIVTVPAINDNDDREPFIKIKGITDVKLGPLEYQSLWKNEKGYQRPAELATVRLRFMVEVLTNFGTYVPDQRYLDFRGATYLFSGREDHELLYKHEDTGVLSYSETMRRPLSFLEPYIGKRALNPLQLGDPAKSV